jgi:hypothetical protein
MKALRWEPPSSSLTRYLLFPSFDVLLDFMVKGLELTPDTS